MTSESKPGVFLVGRFCSEAVVRQAHHERMRVKGYDYWSLVDAGRGTAMPCLYARLTAP